MRVAYEEASPRFRTSITGSSAPSLIPISVWVETESTSNAHYKEDSRSSSSFSFSSSLTLETSPSFIYLPPKTETPPR
jgi:hypothetical protein